MNEKIAPYIRKFLENMNKNVLEKTDHHPDKTRIEHEIDALKKLVAGLYALQQIEYEKYLDLSENKGNINE